MQKLDLFRYFETFRSYLDFQTKTSRILFYGTFIMTWVSYYATNPIIFATIIVLAVVSKMIDHLRYFENQDDDDGYFVQYYKYWQKLIKADQPRDKLVVNDDEKTCTLKIHHRGKKYLILLPYDENLLREPKRIFTYRGDKLLELTHPPGVPMMNLASFDDDLVILDSNTGIMTDYTKRQQI